MHTTVPEAVALAGKIEDGVEDQVRGGAETPAVVICPPLTALSAVADVLRGRTISVGAQNCYWDDDEPHTGEVTPGMLAGIASHVIVGHSERRAAGESDDDIARKVAAVSEAGLVPILCVGDARAGEAPGREAEGQLLSALSELSATATGELLVAYEPVWAIGGEQIADPTHVGEAIDRLAAVLGEHKFDAGLLYGGSITPDDVGQAKKITGLDGLLVGHESLNDQHFLSIIQQAAA